MQNDENFIETEPKKQDIDEVLLWLKSERDSDGCGFYNNKKIIEESFERGKSIVFKHGNENIGIVIWHEYGEYEKMRVDIDIFVIHPYYRKQGYGGFYYKTISDFFRNNGFKVIMLFCEPRISESFWKKMGLVKFPNCGYRVHELTYYDILVNTSSNAYINNADKIELWNVEPYEAKRTEPKWIWYVESQDDVLLYPIIHPCNHDWNLRWSRNDTVLREEKVKYFTNEYEELYYSQFMYIDKLIE
jgi:GNAT superfamily N-acetyltransferase